MSRPKRRQVVPAMLRRQHFWDSMKIGRPNVMINSVLAGCQAALIIAIALPVVHMTPWSNMIGYAGLGALAALFGRFAPRGQRTKTVFMAGLCMLASVLLMSLASYLGLPEALLIVLLALMSGALHFICIKGRFGPPGALIFIFAATAAMRAPASLEELGARGAMTAVVALGAVVICALTERLRFKGDDERPLPQDMPQSNRDIMKVSTRIFVAALIASGLALALGMSHSGWAAMGAIAVLVGTQLKPSLNRAVQRTSGTLVGCLVILAVLAFDPNVWVIFALIVVLQILTEVVIGFNYGYAQVFVTPMALLMTYLANPSVDGVQLSSERIIDTFIGVAVALVIAVVTSSRQDRRAFIDAHSR